MSKLGIRAVLITTLLAVGALSPSLVAAVKVRTDFDKAFDFKSAKTWAFAQIDSGNVMLARSANDDKEVFFKRIDPVVREALSTELPRRNLQPASGAPDLTVTYYALLSIGTSTQTMGQFVPTIPAWGLPLLPMSTTSIQVLEQGTLVIDMSAKGQVVWRGVASAGLKPDTEQAKRTKIVRDAVKNILARFPPKT